VHRGKSNDEGWCGFDPTTVLDASDPMFRVIGKRFLELQEEVNCKILFLAASKFGACFLWTGVRDRLNLLLRHVERDAGSIHRRCFVESIESRSYRRWVTTQFQLFVLALICGE
jgi:hypothetical protein